MGFSEVSFGHTGYSGMSIWIDPATDAFVVLLTARLEYKRVKEFSRLRSDLSTLAAGMFAAPLETVEIF
jgi:CubicO group peptidase (beta-lactamase class C family)